MTDMVSPSFCSKCGRPVPPDADFCTVCGTRIRASLIETPSSPSSVEAANAADAVTSPLPAGASATSAITAIGHSVRFGEGGFRAGDQIGPRYTILKLLGVGGMGAV